MILLVALRGLCQRLNTLASILRSLSLREWRVFTEFSISYKWNQCLLIIPISIYFSFCATVGKEQFRRTGLKGNKKNNHILGENKRSDVPCRWNGSENGTVDNVRNVVTLKIFIHLQIYWFLGCNYTGHFDIMLKIRIYLIWFYCTIE